MLRSLPSDVLEASEIIGVLLVEDEVFIPRGPWNESGNWVVAELAAIQAEEPPAIVTESSPPVDEAGLREPLMDELRDILPAEK